MLRPSTAFVHETLLQLKAWLQPELPLSESRIGHHFITASYNVVFKQLPDLVEIAHIRCPRISWMGVSILSFIELLHHGKIGLSVVHETLRRVLHLSILSDEIRILEQLHNIDAFKLIDGLNCPVFIGEVHISVDPSNIFGMLGQSLQKYVQQILLNPKRLGASYLHVMWVCRLGYIVAVSCEHALNCPEFDMRKYSHVPLKLFVQINPCLGEDWKEE